MKVIYDVGISSFGWVLGEKFWFKRCLREGFPDGSAVKNLPTMQEITDLIPELGRFPGEGNDGQRVGGLKWRL